MEPLAPEDLVEEWSDLSTSSLAPGARLGRYELLLPVAHGGMARVWAARQTGQRGFSKLVAIKTILPHLAHNPEFERMFLDEARIAAGVHHPNVTEIYELGEEGHVLYLAMEWVNGDSLVHMLRGIAGKATVAGDPRIAARIVADACAGLHAAHELTDDDGRLLNVVHRDVSPHNILVSLEGTVKVTDFGVAKAYGQSHQATTAGQIKGKVAYMAPEQIGGMPFDRRSDIFGMGCVLYEASTGVQAFRGGNDPQVMQAVLKGVYEPPAKLVKGYPAELTSIIERALAPEPRQRFATAERMRVALEEWLAKSGQVVTATQVGSFVRQRLGPQLDRRREHVRAAMQSAQDQDPGSGGGMRPAAGMTPSGGGAMPGPSAGHSHSGVVATGPAAAMAPGQPFRPQAPTDPMLGQRAPPPLPVAASGGQPPESMARYAVAAAAGIGFALVVGGLAVILWWLTRSPAPEGSAAPAYSKPAVTATAIAPAVASTLPAVASTSSAPGAPSASAAPATVNINDLPTVKPWWANVPTGGGGGSRAPAASASAKSPDIPANPY
jgi:serine/threonine-protein kinase